MDWCLSVPGCPLDKIDQILNDRKTNAKQKTLRLKVPGMWITSHMWTAWVLRDRETCSRIESPGTCTWTFKGYSLCPDPTATNILQSMHFIFAHNKLLNKGTFVKEYQEVHPLIHSFTAEYLWSSESLYFQPIRLTPSRHMEQGWKRTAFGNSLCPLLFTGIYHV